MDFTLTTTTTAIGAGTPSRAISITPTGSGTLASDANFALSDGSAGGTFFPASPLTIASGQSAGATTQFVYTPAAGATGTIVLQAIATGGISATHTLSLPIGTATVFAKDTFLGSDGTALLGSTPDTGADWAQQSNAGSALELSGSGSAYQLGGANFRDAQYIPTAAATDEYDVSCDFVIASSLLDAPGITIAAQVSTTSPGTGYGLVWAAAGAYLVVYPVGTILFGPVGSISTGATHHVRLALRTINGAQTLFALTDGVLLSDTAYADSTLTGGYAGILNQCLTTVTSATASQYENFAGSNVDWSVSPTLTLSGPTSGTAGSPSTNFTVTGTDVSGSATVTPNDDSSGGTFTPTSLTLTSESPTGTFTYTASGAGTYAIAITGPIGYSIAGSPISYAASSGTAAVTFPNADIYISPYVFRIASGSVIFPLNGYLKFRVTGTTQILANVDTTINSGVAADNMPSLKVTIGTQPSTFVQFGTSDTQVTLATGLDTGTTYPVRIEVVTGTLIYANGWSAETAQTKIDGLVFDHGATLSAPTIRAKNALFYGDSYLEGYYGQSVSGPTYDYLDFTTSWPFGVAFALDCEYGQIGIGSGGWIATGHGNYPVFGSWWNQLDSTHARDFTTPPDYVFECNGINDSGANQTTLQATIQAWLTSARAAWPNAQIFLVVPFDGVNRTAKTNAVTAQADPKVHLIDCGTEDQTVVFGGSPTWASPDGFHLSALYQGLLIGCPVAAQARAALVPSSASTPVAPIIAGTYSQLW